MHQFCRDLFRTSLTILTGVFVCFLIRMTMRAALVPTVAVSQTAPRLWLSPAASSRLPPATQTCPQVNDGPWAAEAILPPCSENDHLGRVGLGGGGQGNGVRLRLGAIYTTEKSWFCLLASKNV